MAAVTEPVPASAEQINQDILRVLSPPSILYVIAVLLVMGLVAAGVAALAYQTWLGFGVTGLNHPVMWGVYITSFVFWVGIAHAGTLISAILYLFRAKWRNAINRGAEAMTVFAVITAALFPLIHIGRLWKFYFMLPYPNQRGLWINFRSPLVWDVFAVSTYMTISILFLYVGLLPDIAAARDKCTDWRRHLYNILALGWRGTTEQWRHHARTVLHLSGLATPLVLSVHSVVSWDFAVSIVPGWHTTIFAPYFVAGAIFSGMAMVITLMVPVRKAFRLEAHIRSEHFDNMGKFLVLTSAIVAYAYVLEFFMAWYSGNPFEQGSFWHRAFGDYAWATWIMIICNVVAPLPLWIKRARLSIPTIWVISILVNIGMWFERFVIITTGLAHEYNPAAWGYYRPSWVELTILLASFAWFLMWFLIFLRIFPIVAIHEVKELHYEGQEEGGALMAEVLGILATPRLTIGAIESLKDAGFGDVEVYSPVPSHEIEHAVGKGASRVRLWTLIGGLAGAATGYLMTIWMSYDWPLVVGGKPFASIPAYTVIAFELTILFGGVLTVLGLITHGLLMTAKRHTAYRPAFSEAQFGCLVRCHVDHIPRVQELLRTAGSTEVRVVEA